MYTILNDLGNASFGCAYKMFNAAFDEKTGRNLSDYGFLCADGALQYSIANALGSFSFLPKIVDSFIRHTIATFLTHEVFSAFSEGKQISDLQHTNDTASQSDGVLRAAELGNHTQIVTGDAIQNFAVFHLFTSIVNDVTSNSNDNLIGGQYDNVMIENALSETDNGMNDEMNAMIQDLLH